jgi:hypothetical protein
MQRHHPVGRPLPQAARAWLRPLRVASPYPGRTGSGMTATILQFHERKRHVCAPCWDDLRCGAEVQLYHFGVIRVCEHLAREGRREAERVYMLSGQLEAAR